MFGLFDKAEVSIDVPDRVLMEDEIPCEISIVPKSKANLRKIEVELFCQETAITRGTTDSYYRKVVYNDLRTPRKETKLRAGETIIIRETFRLPAFTTPTIYTYNHYVEWFIRVRLDVPWWPDTRKQQPIAVLPFKLAPEVARQEGF